MSEYSNSQLLLLPEAWEIGKMYSAKPIDGSGDVPLVRSTDAWRLNSLGIYEKKAINEPLLEYPSCPSFLYEPTRYNYALWSMDFSNAVWQVGGAAAKALSAAPSIIQGKSAYDITGLNIYGSDFFYQNLVQGANSTYSVIIKAIDAGDVGKTITLTTGGGTGRQIILTADFVKYELTSTSSETYFYLTKGNSGTAATQFTICYGGVETGLFATNPIETSGAAFQRVYPSSTLTGLISKGFLNASGCTFFIKFFGVKKENGGIGIRIGNTSGGFGLEIGGSADNRLHLWYTTTGSASETSIGVTPISATLAICFTITPTQILIYCNGALIYTVNGTFSTTDLTYTVIDGSAFRFLLAKVEMQPVVLTGVEAIALTNE